MNLHKAMRFLVVLHIRTVRCFSSSSSSRFKMQSLYRIYHFHSFLQFFFGRKGLSQDPHCGMRLLIAVRSSAVYGAFVVRPRIAGARGGSGGGFYRPTSNMTLKVLKPKLRWRSTSTAPRQVRSPHTLALRLHYHS